MVVGLVPMLEGGVVLAGLALPERSADYGHKESLINEEQREDCLSLTRRERHGCIYQKISTAAGPAPTSPMAALPRMIAAVVRVGGKRILIPRSRVCLFAYSTRIAKVTDKETQKNHRCWELDAICMCIGGGGARAVQQPTRVGTEPGSAELLLSASDKSIAGARKGRA